VARSLENNALKIKSRTIYSNFRNIAQSLFCLQQNFLLNNRWKFRTKLLRFFEDIEVFVEGSFLAAPCMSRSMETSWAPAYTAVPHQPSWYLGFRERSWKQLSYHIILNGRVRNKWPLKSGKLVLRLLHSGYASVLSCNKKLTRYVYFLSEIVAHRWAHCHYSATHITVVT